MRRGLAGVIVCLAASVASAQGDRHLVLDHILDTYVREGNVYYRALAIERAPLDRYVSGLDVAAAEVATWPSREQQAFWINAYNALVLRTVIDAYPIRPRSDAFPANSVRQIPGAFNEVRHVVGGRSVTLDEIEALLVDEFRDARLALALGRGAMGSSRLRSEAYSGRRLEAQLEEMVRECATQVRCVRIDTAQDVVEVSPMIGWLEPAFVQTFEPRATAWRSRSAIERAVAGMVYPHVFRREQRVLDRDTFRMRYGEFDWRLNDLGARPPAPAAGQTGRQR